MAGPKRDIGAELESQPAILAQTYSDDTADVTGEWIDTRSNKNLFHSFVFALEKNSGDSGDDLTFKVEHSSTDDASNNSNLTDVFGSEFTLNLTGAKASGEIDVSNVKTKRYIRVKLNSGDATLGGADTDLGGFCIKGGAAKEQV